MKKLYLTFFFFAVLFIGCQSQPKPAVTKPVRVSIPFSFAFNNDYFPSAATRVIITDARDSVVFENKGYQPSWGLQPKGNIITTGKHKVHVVFYTDSVTKREFEEFFTVAGNEKQFDISVNLMAGFRGQSNELYVNKYYGNQYKVQLKRLWNPQQQYNAQKELLPGYEWTNPSDSTIFGIYRRRSASSMTSWVQNWNIAYMQFQMQVGAEWVYLPCNAPRIGAEIKKGQTGKTLTDMVLSCDAKEFASKGRYRVLIEYAINNAVLRKTPAAANAAASVYYEVHIYQVTDEFTIE
jgi:hypothetical protein